MLQLSDEEWEAVLAHPSLSPVAFSLNEMRTQARRRLPASQEALASALAVDGYHAWGELYNTKIVGRMSISIEREGQVQEMSVGQVANLFASPDRALRHERLPSSRRMGRAGGAVCQALNHLAGFRLSLYKARVGIRY